MYLHQIIAGAAPHDAITDQAILLQGWLQDLGFQSEIYAGHIETGFETSIRPMQSYRDRGEPYIIYHHSLGTDVVDQVLALRKRLWIALWIGALVLACASQEARAEPQTLQPFVDVASHSCLSATLGIGKFILSEVPLS